VFDLTRYDTQLGQREEVKDRVKGMRLTRYDSQLGQQEEVKDRVKGMCLI